MSHSGYNARDAWAAFNGLCHRAAKAALPPNRPHLTKRDQIRERKHLKKQIRDDWERIKTDHRDDHIGLKLDLGHAIRMTTAAGRLVERAVREIERGESDAAKVYEDLISAEERALSAMKDLATVARRVGRAAQLIMAHATGEVVLLKRNIEHTSEQVAVRHQEEDGNAIGTTYRRDTFQRNSHSAPPPGGRQWFQTSRMASCPVLAFVCPAISITRSWIASS